MKRKFLGVCVLLVFLFGCATFPTAKQHEEKTLNFVVMGYHRLSHGVNNTVKKDSFLDITGS
jgi:hypothetical protein